MLVYWFIRTRSRLLLVSLGCSLLLSAAAISYDRWAYSSDPDWSRYMQNMNGRRRLDNKWCSASSLEEDWKVTGPIFEKVGWSKNDTGMYREWFFTDETVYSRENLDAIAAAFENHTRQDRQGRKGIAQYAGGLLRSLAVFCLNGLAAVLLCRRRRLFSVLTLLTMGLASAVALVLLFRFRLPHRVSISIVFIVCTLLPFVAVSDECPGRSSTGKRPRRRIGRSQIAALCFLLLLSARQIRGIYVFLSPTTRTKQAAFERTIDKMSADILTLDQRPILVFWGSAFPEEWASAFSNELAGLPCKGRIELGWAAHSPVFKANLRKLSIQNVCKAVYDRQDVYLVAKLENMPLLVTFVKEHHGVEIAYREIFRYAHARGGDGTVSIVKAYRVSPAKDETDGPVGTRELPPGSGRGASGFLVSAPGPNVSYRDSVPGTQSHTTAR